MLINSFKRYMYINELEFLSGTGVPRHNNELIGWYAIFMYS